MNDDIVITWTPVVLDIGGQPANVLGYKIWDMSSGTPVEAADVPSGPHTLVGYVADATLTYSFAVSAYNAQGEGLMSTTIVAALPTASIPEQVTGVTVTIIPK